MSKMKKMTAMVLVLCLILGGYISPGMKAQANVGEWDKWNNVAVSGTENQAKVTEKEWVSYKEEPETGKYMKKVTLAVASSKVAGAEANYHQIAIASGKDSDGNQVYTYLKYRFNGQGKLMPFTSTNGTHWANGGVFDHNNNKVATYEVTASGTDQVIAVPSSNVMSDFTIVAEYVAKNVMTITFANGEVSSSYTITAKDDTTNFYNEENKIMFYVSGATTLKDANVEWGDVPANPYAQWENISEEGVATTNQIIHHTDWEKIDNKYLDSVELAVTESGLRSNNNNTMHVIYDYVDNDNYSYFEYRFTDKGYLYGRLQEKKNGTVSSQGTDVSDSGECNNVQLAKKDMTTISDGTKIADVVTVGTKGKAKGYSFSVQYTGKQTVSIIFKDSNGTNTVKLDITSGRENVNFISDTHKFALLTKPDVTFGTESAPQVKYLAVSSVPVKVYTNVADLDLQSVEWKEHYGVSADFLADVVVYEPINTEDIATEIADFNEKKVILVNNVNDEEAAKAILSYAKENSMPYIDLKAYGSNDAQIVADAIYACIIVTTENDIVSVTYNFDESILNSFLTPILTGATLKTAETLEKQNLGFRTTMPVKTRTGSSITEYGTLLAYYPKENEDTILSKMVCNGNSEESTEVVCASAAYNAESPIHQFTAGVGVAFSTANLRKQFIARSYVKYADGTIYYSVADGTASVNNLAKASGVVKGYAVRSLYDVAKNMVIKLAENGTSIDSVGRYADKKFSIKKNEDGSVDSTTIDAMFTLIKDNAGSLE